METATEQHKPVPFDLDELAGATGLANWMFDQFADSVAPAVIEVGPGVGTFTERLLGAGVERLHLVEIDQRLCDHLAGRFGADPRVTIACEALPEAPSLAATPGEWGLVLCQNVLEHIEDDHTTLADFARVLPPGGHLVLLVPSMKALYGTLDKHLNHFRRYSMEELRAAVTAAGFEIETLRFLNRPAVFGWWLSSRVLKRRVMPKGQLKAFKWAMPLLRLEEKTEPGFGLSLLVLARRT